MVPPGNNMHISLCFSYLFYECTGYQHTCWKGLQYHHCTFSYQYTNPFWTPANSFRKWFPANHIRVKPAIPNYQVEGHQLFWFVTVVMDLNSTLDIPGPKTLVVEWGLCSTTVRGRGSLIWDCLWDSCILGGEGLQVPPLGGSRWRVHWYRDWSGRCGLLLFTGGRDATSHVHVKERLGSGEG